MDPTAATTAAFQADTAAPPTGAASSTSALLAEFVKFSADPQLYEQDVRETERPPKKPKKSGGGLFGGLFKAIVKFMKPAMEMFSKVASFIPGLGPAVGMFTKAVGAIGALLANGDTGGITGLLKGIPGVAKLANMFGIGNNNGN